VKFTEHGSIGVEVAELTRDGNEAVLEFAVTDTGIGIAADRQAQLFNPFYQADSSTTRAYGGTGLGLSIVRNLARLMGGDTGVESEGGKGSRFSFRVRVEIVQPGEESRQSVRGAACKGPAPAQLSCRVLVAEDNPTNRKVIEAALRKLGIGAEIVENGQEAVDALATGERPDLVLMDLQMPVLDGLAATARIRRQEAENRQPRLPIVALTAGAFDEDRQHCLAAGMDDFLTKPIDMNDLQSLIAKWTADPARRSPPERRPPE
jgi:CheY-like chemotaxis protein